MHLKTRTLC